MKSGKLTKQRQKLSVISVMIADALENEISEGKFTVGQRLPSQAMLCRRFKVSVTAVREAIHQLNARGLIQTSRGAGSFLADRSLVPFQQSLLHYARLASKVQDYSELMEIRLMLETTCAQKVARQPSPALLGKLHHCLEVMKRKSQKTETFSEADADFHMAIVEGADNSLIKAIHDALQPMTRRFMRMTYQVPEQFKRNYLEHSRIYEAILAGNVARAASEMAAHLTYSKRNNEALLAKTCASA